MENPLSYLENCLYHERFLGKANDELIKLTRHKLEKINNFNLLNHDRRLMICEFDPIQFLSSFLAAYEVGYSIFLSNPSWGEQEWDQALKIMRSGWILKDEDSKYYEYAKTNDSLYHDQWILIPTGGSSGKIRFAIHTWQSLCISARGFQQYFQLEKVNSLCVLPLYHVSGLMQAIRCLITGGQLVIRSWKDLETAERIDCDLANFFISLVPTQLQRLLQNLDLIPELCRFKAILLGGAPAWPDLLQKARDYKIPLAITYGMTETASQVSTLKPVDFLNGNNSSGQVLPHIEVRILDTDGNPLPPQHLGRISIQSNALSLGYYPELSSDSTSFQSNDIGYFDDQNYLHITGRIDNQIVTGGEKVSTEEIEEMIRSTNLVQDVCVVGIPDHEWGQAIAAVYIPASLLMSESVLDQNLQAKCRLQLSNYKQPKYWICVESLPRNQQGKINREQILRLIQQRFSQ